MKIYFGIGTTEAQLAPSYLLKKSLFKHSEGMNIDVSNICDEPEAKKLNLYANLSLGTVFSLQRFLVCEIAKRKKADVAIYIDSDIICMNSYSPMIKLFYNSEDDFYIPTSNKLFQQPVQTAVTIMKVSDDNLNFFNEILALYFKGQVNYQQAISDFYKNRKYTFIGHKYNSRDFFEDDTVFLHYTDLWTQPWVSSFRKEGSVWKNEHQKLMSVDNEYFKLVKDGVLNKYYKPDMLDLSFASYVKSLIFLPPQFAVYFNRNSFLRFFPKSFLGISTQLVGFFRAFFNIRTT
ncbi:MAG: hypothetical protein P8N23_05090 [Methylophilaceae bacterium]|nr:hypothetical protein [Methylophilaceae bacterium]